VSVQTQEPFVLDKLRGTEQTYEELSVSCHASLWRWQHRALVHGAASTAAAWLIVRHAAASLKLILGRQMRMADPEVAASTTEFQRVAKAAADIEPTVAAFRAYNEAQLAAQEAREMLRESASARPCRGCVSLSWVPRQGVARLSLCVCRRICAERAPLLSCAWRAACPPTLPLGFMGCAARQATPRWRSSRGRRLRRSRRPWTS